MNVPGQSQYDTIHERLAKYNTHRSARVGSLTAHIVQGYRYFYFSKIPFSTFCKHTSPFKY